jgi:cytochrome P450
MFPPAQSNIRGTDEEMNVGGYYIPANSNFLVNVVGVHYSPDYWESPEKFNPDRFTPENMAKMHPYQV